MVSVRRSGTVLDGASAHSRVACAAYRDKIALRESVLAECNDDEGPVADVRDDEEKMGRKGNIRGDILMCACFYCFTMSCILYQTSPRRFPGSLGNLLLIVLRMQIKLHTPAQLRHPINYGRGTDPAQLLICHIGPQGFLIAAPRNPRKATKLYLRKWNFSRSLVLAYFSGYALIFSALLAQAYSAVPRSCIRERGDCGAFRALDGAALSASRATSLITLLPSISVGPGVATDCSHRVQRPMDIEP